MENYLDRRFDDQFEKIENLMSYPWVGKKYVEAPVKVLIIGEISMP